MRTRRSRFSGRIDELLPSLKTPEIENILGSEERIKNETIFATNLSEGTDVAGEHQHRAPYQGRALGRKVRF